MERMTRYGNNSCTGNNNCSNSKNALRKIQELDFAIYETILYLDAYPDSRDALAYYHSLMNARDTLVAEYEANVGPLTAFTNTDQNSWNWVKSPWPWEYEANV